ncbi:MAG: phosphotransferase [Arenicellales bacterium]|nr:phosphotransferase [Arenicellales bacterium]
MGVEVAPVDPTVENVNKLTTWCESHIEGFRGPLTLEKFSIGQSNPTYLLQTEFKKYVLRRKPTGVLLKSAHAVDREYRVMQALAKTPVPVPKVYALCENQEIIGTTFFVMEFLESQTFLDPVLPDLSPQHRRALYEDQVNVIATLSSIDPNTIGLADFGKPGNYMERQVSRWTKQYRASETEVIEEMERLIDWLPTHLPQDEARVALVHGDFRLDNLLIDPKEPKVIGIVDWELSTLGHPFVDFSYWSTMLRLPRTTHHKGLAGEDRTLLGIPTEEELLTLYRKLSGEQIPGDWSFWLAFHCFRFSAIVQGVLKRYLDGNASSPLAREVGSMARPVAELGWKAVDERTYT